MSQYYKPNRVKNIYDPNSLYYDENNKAVGFLFTNSEEESHKFSLIKSKQGYGASIVATSFFKTYNLEPIKYRGRYNWERKNQEGIGELYVIKLVEKTNTNNEPVV